VHHVILEQWSRRTSALHNRDARVKLAATAIMLVAIATTPPQRGSLAYSGYMMLILAGALMARLPIVALLLRASLVLPFCLIFAGLSWFNGDVARAIALVARSYISAASVLLLVATTRLPDLLRALEWYRVPGLLILVTQFLYRYLFVLSEQAQHMRLAAKCRSGVARSRTARQSQFEGAAGALSVLFVRSYLRAEGIHRAMLARGFSGHFPVAATIRVGSTDLVFLGLAGIAPVLIRTWAIR
jgi:cobalt/nickel transport system permease protein